MCLRGLTAYSFEILPGDQTRKFLNTADTILDAQRPTTPFGME